MPVTPNPSFAGGVEEWLDFMPETVTITPWTARSVSTAPTYGGTPYSAPCRIEIKNHLIIDASGREVLARGRVFMASLTVPGIKDQVTLPAEYVPVNPPILAVNVQDDELGTHHITLEIG